MSTLLLSNPLLLSLCSKVQIFWSSSHHTLLTRYCRPQIWVTPHHWLVITCSTIFFAPQFLSKKYMTTTLWHLGFSTSAGPKVVFLPLQPNLPFCLVITINWATATVSASSFPLLNTKFWTFNSPTPHTFSSHALLPVVRMSNSPSPCFPSWSLLLQLPFSALPV